MESPCSGFRSAKARSISKPWSRAQPRRARAGDLARFLALAKNGRPYDKPHIVADVAESRGRYMDALKIQQLDHMERSLDYCRKTLDLGVRWRA
jgi:hypothetical protein